MKTYILKHSILALLTLLFITSCRKESVQDPEVTLGAPEAATEASTLVESTDEAITYRMSPSSPISTGECPTVRWSEQMGIYPNTLTIDFGDGCTGRHGHRFYGQITVEVTGHYFAEGSKRTIHTDNFRMDGTRYTFHRVVTNQGNDLEGRMYWTIVADLTRQKGNNGNTTEWHADRVRTLVGGMDTEDDVTDDMYHITGTAVGTRPNGRWFESTITTPLVKRADCAWIVSGVEMITIEGHDGVRVLDYGDGACDNVAVLTHPDGEVVEIQLNFFFRPWR
jgi:hypothetical protein